MNANSNKVWLAGGSLAIVVVVAGGYLLGVAPMLAAAAASDASRLAIEQQNIGYEQQLVDLQADYAGIDADRRDLAAARITIPATVDDADFVGELHDLQSTSGATITGFVVSAAKPFSPVVVALPDAPAEPATGEEAAAASTTETADAASTTETADTVPAAVAVPAVPGAESVTSENFRAIPYTVSVSGSLEQTRAFVTGLQNASRLFLVTGLSFAVDEASEGYTANVDGYIWVYDSAPAGIGTTSSAATAAAIDN